jgi:sterol desaturase/sphingolipid hydroxylase (fatty acid hydroxylase superfamily)
MSLWADNYQDILEWAIIPFLAYQVIRLSFAELWLASGYTLYVEAAGHSGIRAYWPHPLLTPALKPFGMELAIEDHDIHHRYTSTQACMKIGLLLMLTSTVRYGRGGKNYGKQTRVWDVLFGTAARREEDRIYVSSANSKRAP